MSEAHTKEEVSHPSGGWSRESKNASLKNGVETAGRELFRGSGSTICNESKACRRARRKGGDEAAAKDVKSFSPIQENPM